LEQVRKELRELEPARPPPTAPLLGAAAAGSMVQVGPGLWGFPGQTCPPLLPPGQTCPPLLPPGNAQATRDDFFEPPRKRRAHRDDYSRPARRRLEPDHGEEFEVYEARTGARPFHARGREDRLSDDDDDYELFEQAQRRSRAGRFPRHSYSPGFEDRFQDVTGALVPTRGSRVSPVQPPYLQSLQCPFTSPPLKNGAR
jgi:hypothetical protein